MQPVGSRPSRSSVVEVALAVDKNGIVNYIAIFEKFEGYFKDSST